MQDLSCGQAAPAATTVSPANVVAPPEVVALPTMVPTACFVPVTSKPPPLAVDPLLAMFTTDEPLDKADTVPASCNVAPAATVAVTPDWTVRRRS